MALNNFYDISKRLTFTCPCAIITLRSGARGGSMEEEFKMYNPEHTIFVLTFTSIDMLQADLGYLSKDILKL